MVLGNWNAGYPTLQPFKGMNLHWVKEWSREWVFVDVMKSLEKWKATTPTGIPFDTGGAVQTNSNGWPILPPGAAVHAVFFAGTDGRYPDGIYEVSLEVTTAQPGDPWDEDDLGVVFDNDAINNSTLTAGQMTFDVVSRTHNGIKMRIANNHPSTTITVHNIKVWMPGYKDAESPFHPLFIKRLRPFSVIRFMDWQRTNTVGNPSQQSPQDGMTSNDGEGWPVKWARMDWCRKSKAD